MSLRVLLADESASIKKVFQLGLQDYAAEVKSVQSGLDVLEVALAFQPDIIFADILLQKVNGYAVCEQLKKHPQLSNIPVVLMWSSFMELDHQKYKACGAHGEIEKPFDVEQMRDQIRNLVPRTQEQNIASFLKFPASIHQEFVQEEQQRELPPTAETGPMGHLTITPPEPEAEAPFDDNESVFNITPPGVELEDSDGDLSDDFNLGVPNLDGTVDQEFVMEPVAPLATEQSMDTSVDVTSWQVPAPDFSQPDLREPHPEPEPEAEEILLQDTPGMDNWESTDLNHNTSFEDHSVASTEDTAEGFSSFDLGDDSEDALDLDQFLFKPDEAAETSTDTDLSSLAPALAATAAAGMAIGATQQGSQVVDPDEIRRAVEEIVTQHLASEKIEALVRAHAQEVIKINVMEQLPRMIEKIAREELDKILQEELNDKNPAGSPS